MLLTKLGFGTSGTAKDPTCCVNGDLVPFVGVWQDVSGAQSTRPKPFVVLSCSGSAEAAVLDETVDRSLEKSAHTRSRSTAATSASSPEWAALEALFISVADGSETVWRSSTNTFVPSCSPPDSVTCVEADDTAAGLTAKQGTSRRSSDAGNKLQPLLRALLLLFDSALQFVSRQFSRLPHTHTVRN